MTGLFREWTLESNSWSSNPGTNIFQLFDCGLLTDHPSQLKCIYKLRKAIYITHSFVVRIKSDQCLAKNNQYISVISLWNTLRGASLCVCVCVCVCVGMYLSGSIQESAIKSKVQQDIRKKPPLEKASEKVLTWGGSCFNDSKRVVRMLSRG